MKIVSILFFLVVACGAFAQPYWYYDGSDVPFNENELSELKRHGVHTLSQRSDKEPPYIEEEWEFSRAGKVIAYRMFEYYSDEEDPYPMLPDTVIRAPQDTVYFDGPNGTKRAQCVNYCFFSTYGIWRRSFYYTGHYANRPGMEDMCYNEMQYAFDADSNLIFYMSQLDYARPNSLYALKWLARFDTLGYITEVVGYDSGICEFCANWYPRFDTAQYESIKYDLNTGQRTHTTWEKQTWQYELLDQYPDGCDHCAGNRSEIHTDIQPITPRDPVAQPFEYPLSRKEERKRRRHPPPAVLFEGNRAVIGRYEYEVTYR